MKKSLLLLLSLLSYLTLQAQNCGTTHEHNATLLKSMPYYGNMTFLESITDSVNTLVNNPIARYVGNETVFQIPVKVWHYDNPTTPTASIADIDTEEEIEARINAINTWFATRDIPVFLYLACDISFIVSATDATAPSRDRQAAMRRERKLWGSLSIHILEEVEGTTRGRAAFPWSRDGDYALFVINSAPIDTWIHEIGHCFGLFHTDQNSRGDTENNGTARPCFQEYVSRTARNRLQDGCPFTHDRPHLVAASRSVLEYTQFLARYTK